MAHTVITVVTSSLHKISCIFVCSNIYGGKQQTIINTDSTNKRRQRANTMFFTHRTKRNLRNHLHVIAATCYVAALPCLYFNCAPGCGLR